MDRTTDSHAAYYTTLQLTTKQGMKSIMVKIDPRAMAKTTPLSKYHRNFPISSLNQAIPNKVSYNQHPRHGYHMTAPPSIPWPIHCQSPTQDQGQVPHYPLLHRQGCNQPTNTLVLCSFGRLGILKFKVLNKAPTILINVVTTLDEKKLTKKVTFWTPLETTQPETSYQHSGSVTIKPT